MREKDDEASVTAGGRGVEVKGEGRTGRGYREIQTLCFFFFLVQQKKRPDSKGMASPRGVRVEGGGGRGRWSSSQRRRFISTVVVCLFFYPRWVRRPAGVSV